MTLEDITPEMLDAAVLRFMQERTRPGGWDTILEFSQVVEHSREAFEFVHLMMTRNLRLTAAEKDRFGPPLMSMLCIGVEIAMQLQKDVVQ